MSTPFEISDRLTEEFCDLSPIAATGVGVPGRDHLWDDTSPEGHAARAAFYSSAIAELEPHLGHPERKQAVAARVLSAARLASDVLDVPTLLFARTDAEAATLLTSDVDERDREFLTGERTAEGYYRIRPGLESAIARSLSYAPYADVLWCETKTPDLDEARRFAEAIHDRFPGKLLAYNCSPSFNWKRNLDDQTIARFQRELGAMGYRFQFITLAGWHLVNLRTYELARAYARDQMSAYVELQEREFAMEAEGYTAVKHQREVGAQYFDLVLSTLSHGEATTSAMDGSTESAQFA